MPPLPTTELVNRLRAAGCVLAEEEARLLREAAADDAGLRRMVRQRVEGQPLEHILGWAEFAGLRFALEPGVFVPRHRSELLVREATAVAAARTGALVVDLCCGSGALGAAVAASVPGVTLHAADIDSAAVRCAARNVAGFGGVAHHGDLYEALPPGLRGRIDVLVVNAPYVPTAAVDLMPREARLHEAPAALDGGADGLAVQRRVIDGAPGWLAPGGQVLLETSARQAPATSALMTAAGLAARVVSSPEDDATVVAGALALESGMGFEPT